MKKNKKIDIKNAIEDSISVNEENKFLTKTLIKTPIFRIICLGIVLILSIIFGGKIGKLTKMTSKALIGNENILGPVFYFTLIITTILLCISVLVYGLFLDKKEDLDSKLNLKRKFLVYQIYDIGGFVLSCFVYLFFVITIVVTPCNVSGDSMNNTFYENDRVLVWNLGYKVNNNDVVVFDATDYSYNHEEVTFYIKRVIATEGDSLFYEQITSSQGYLYVNDIQIGFIQYHQFLKITGQTGFEFIIPENKVLVLGDNRLNSYDSRSFGLINEEDVIGKVILRYFPNFGYPEPLINS